MHETNNDIINLDEGMVKNFVIKKSAEIILKKLAASAKNDFATLMAYLHAAGLEKVALDTIRSFFRIKASRLDLIANYAIPTIKLESVEIEEGIFDSLSDTYNSIVKYFNLFRVYRAFKSFDNGKFIENNKKIIVSSFIWLLIINGDLVKFLNKIKKEILEN